MFFVKNKSREEKNCGKRMRRRREEVVFETREKMIFKLNSNLKSRSKQSIEERESGKGTILVDLNNLFDGCWQPVDEVNEDEKNQKTQKKLGQHRKYVKLVENCVDRLCGVSLFSSMKDAMNVQWPRHVTCIRHCDSVMLTKAKIPDITGSLHGNMPRNFHKILILVSYSVQSARPCPLAIEQKSPRQFASGQN